MLRECFIAPCNYYQKAYALSPELFDCIHQARVSESFQSDYYAFGMCIAYAATGIDTWEKYSEDDFKALRLSESTAKLLLDRLSVSEDLKNFIKGCTLENPIERWTTRSIADWLSGKTSKVVNTEIREAVSALVFNRKNYFNAKAVAHAMFNNWELAVQFLKDDKLLKWVQRAITKTKLVEEINKIYEQSGKIKDVAMLSDKEDQMFRILQSLDPHGPIRCKNIAITITSFGRLLIDAVVLHHKEHIELILKILRSRYWEYSATAGGKHELRIKMIASFEKCIALYNPSQKGFTIERLMYMFNPNLPCLSDAIEGDYITDVASLLNKLDSLCEKYNNKVNFIDPHIFAYICEKLSIRSEVNIKKLSPYPAICSDEHVNALSIFVIANQEFKNLKFKHLAQFIALKLIDLLNTQLHNKRFKSYMEVALKESSVKGDLSKLLNVFTNTHMIQTDRHGFIIATKEVTALSRKILLLSDTKKIKLMGMFLGQRATVLLSYCLLFIILVFVYFGKL
jgi:hypothetical protein